jgi:hypothetical protein
MTSNPCTIDADRSVAYAAKMMLEEDVGLAPILEGDKLIGMLTDRDIATRVAAEGRDPDQVKVRDVASTQLITIDPRQDLDEALRKMAKHQVRRLLVVEVDGRLVGVVAQADIAREGNDAKTGQLVEVISESGGQMSSIEEGQFPVQFPRQIEDQPESLVGEEPQVEEQREEEGVSKVQAASSRGRRKRSTAKRSTGKRKTASRKRSTAKRKTAARKTTGTRKRKTASRKRSTAKRSTTKRRSTAKKRSTTKRRSTAKKRSTTKRRSTAKRRSTGKKRSTAKKRSTGKKRSTAKRKTAGRKAAATRKRKTATRKTAGRKAAATRKRKTASRKRSTSTRKKSTTSRKRTTVRAAGRKGGRATARRRTTRRKTR